LAVVLPAVWLIVFMGVLGSTGEVTAARVIYVKWMPLAPRWHLRAVYLPVVRKQ